METKEKVRIKAIDKKYGIILNALRQRGDTLLPSYEVNNVPQWDRIREGMRNIHCARTAFAEHAQNSNAQEKYPFACAMAEASWFAYKGMRTSVSHLTCKDETLSFVNLPEEDLPPFLRPLYQPQTGLFDAGALVAWIGYLRHDTLARTDKKLVVAFRGTGLSVSQISTDLRQMLEGSVTYLRSAGLILYLAEAFAGEIFITGHSLGGGLAQFSLAANITEDNQDRLCAYCFNSAGLSYFAYQALSVGTKLDLAKNRVFHYAVEGEPVSSSFGQIGRMNTIPVDTKISPLIAHRMATVKRLLKSY